MKRVENFPTNSNNTILRTINARDEEEQKEYATWMPSVAMPERSPCIIKDIILPMIKVDAKTIDKTCCLFNDKREEI
jgi:hypothetical protein